MGRLKAPPVWGRANSEFEVEFEVDVLLVCGSASLELAAPPVLGREKLELVVLPLALAEEGMGVAVGMRVGVGVKVGSGVGVGGGANPPIKISRELLMTPVPCDVVAGDKGVFV